MKIFNFFFFINHIIILHQNKKTIKLFYHKTSFMISIYFMIRNIISILKVSIQTYNLNTYQFYNKNICLNKLLSFLFKCSVVFILSIIINVIIFNIIMNFLLRNAIYILSLLHIILIDNF